MLSGMLQQATIVMGESEGSSQLAYSTIPQLELSLERGGEREKEQERAKEIKKQKKQRKRESWVENKRDQRKSRGK